MANSVDPPLSKGPVFPLKAGPLVLIVDDQPDVRLALAYMLEALDFRVAEAGDAAGALAKLDGLRVDVMLIDLHLGAGAEDGIALIRRVRERSMPPCMIAMSGVYPEEVLEHVLEIADAALAKPFSKEELLRTIKRLLHRRPNPSLRRP
jgi:CheY-like chemotaxis protein